MIRKFTVSALAFAGAIGAATPAAAAVPVTCQGYATTVLAGWDACAGFYDNNVLGGDAAKIALQKEAVESLGGTYDGNFGALFGFASLGDGSNGARTIEFGRTLTGVKIIGMHFGNVGLPKDAFGNVSAFYRFNFGTGASSLTFVESRGLSNLYVFEGPSPAVPEPSTWMLLIGSFGLLGAAMRRRRQAALPATA